MQIYLNRLSAYWRKMHIGNLILANVDRQKTLGKTLRVAKFLLLLRATKASKTIGCAEQWPSPDGVLPDDRL